MDKEELMEQVMEAIKTVYDPEIPVNIFDLGLIYEVSITDEYLVDIKMTLTAPSCPSAQEIPVEVDQKVRGVYGVNDVMVTVVWEPAWDRSMMSEAALLELGFM